MRQSFGVRRIEPKLAPEITPALPPGEAALRFEHAHIWNLAAGVEENLEQVSVRRDVARGTDEGLRTIQAVNALREVELKQGGGIVQLTNEVAQCIVRLDDGREIAAYVKSELGELSFFIDPQTGRLMRNVSKISDGILVTQVQPHDESKHAERLAYAERRAHERDITRRNIARCYGIAPNDVALSLDKLNIRNMDSGRAYRSEYAAGALDRLVGFGVIPPTALREKDGSFATAQAGAPGEPLSDEEAKRLLEIGPAHPGGKSLMRLGCFDYLIKSTDRHMNNFFYDPVTRQFSGIDNGYANGYAQAFNIAGPDGRVQKTEMPVDSYLSFPMEIAEQHEDWLLDDEAVDQMRALFDEIKNHLLFTEGKMDPAAAAALPEHVKKGAAANALSDTYRLLHERTDEKGGIIPASSVIARKEALEFLRRLNHLIVHRKPPFMPDYMQSRAGLKHVFESQTRPD